jgi:O-antigen/teichoic acid export membrane protein
MFKNFLKLFSGNALSQAIQLISLLYLTSLYLPYDFGRLGKIQSFGYILSIFITLQMNQVIPLSKCDNYAINITRAVFTISILNFIISFILLLFIPIDYGFGILLSLVLGLNSTINGYLIYKEKYSIISVLYIIRAVSIVFLQFFLYYLKINNGLLYGAILGELMGFVYLYLINMKELKFNFDFKIEKLKMYILEWKAFSLHGTIQELLSVAIYALPMIFYTEKFGESISGQYSIAFKVIYAPTTLISSSLWQVLYPRFSQKDGFSFLKKNIWFDKRILIVLFLILVFLFNTHYFDFSFLKGRWNITFTLLPYMFINAMFFLFSSPYRLALRALKLNKQLLKIEILTLVFMISLFLFIDLNVLYFTIFITLIGVVQNLLIVLNYRFYEKSINKTI